MDLNHIYFRIHVELSRAKAAACAPSRAAHEGLATEYQRLIEAHRLTFTDAGLGA